MNVDAVKVIEHLTREIAEQAYKIAVLQAQVDALKEGAEHGDGRKAAELES